MHGAGADLEVERRLDHAAALRPEVLQAKDEVLKREARHRRRILTIYPQMTQMGRRFKRVHGWSAGVLAGWPAGVPRLRPVTVRVMQLASAYTAAARRSRASRRGRQRSVALRSDSSIQPRVSVAVGGGGGGG